MISVICLLFLIQFLMELIRNKLTHLVNVLQSQQPELHDYIKAFPNATKVSAQAASRFVQGLNQAIIYIVSSIAQSCKNSSSSDSNQDGLQYSPAEVGKACKIKAKMQQIRYAFQCPSSETNTQIAEIQVLLEEALELCPNQLVYTHFKGATKGRKFAMDEFSGQNTAQEQVQDEENEVLRLKMMDEKRIIYKEVSKHLHAEQQKKRKLEKYRVRSPIQAHNLPNKVYVGVDSRQRIFSGQRKQCLPHRKKYNYLQAFEREEQRLKDQAKNIISNSSKTGKQTNSTSTHQGTESIEKIGTQQQQPPVEVTEFQLSKDGDSIPSSSKQAQPLHETPSKALADPSPPQILRICMKLPQSLHLEPSS